MMTHMLVVDDENKLFQLVPDMTQLLLDHEAMSTGIGGRIIRKTDDVIDAIDPEFKQGYTRTLGGSAIRPVSEQFFLMGVEVVDQVKFDELKATAQNNFNKYNRHKSSGWE